MCTSTWTVTPTSARRTSWLLRRTRSTRTASSWRSRRSSKGWHASSGRSKDAVSAAAPGRDLLARVRDAGRGERAAGLVGQHANLVAGLHIGDLGVGLALA